MRKLLLFITVFTVLNISLSAVYADDVFFEKKKDAEKYGELLEEVEVGETTYYKADVDNAEEAVEKVETAKINKPFKCMGYSKDKKNSVLYEPHLYNNGIFTLHLKGFKGKKVEVAVLDTDFAALSDINYDYDNAYDAVENKPLKKHSKSSADHGTMVAGVIAGVENSNGIIGTAPKATVLPIKILIAEDDEEEGDEYEEDEIVDGKIVDESARSIYDALLYLDEKLDDGKLENLRIVNMSFGAFDPSAINNKTVKYYTDTYMYYKEIADMIKHLHKKHNITFVAAAGNEGITTYGEPGEEDYDYFGDNAVFPADCSYVVSVAMHDRFNRLSTESNMHKKTDLVAFGEDMVSYGGDGKLYAYEGTSCSAPVVSGIFALMYSANPELSESEVLSALKDTGTILRKDISGESDRIESDYKGKTVVNATFAYNKLFNKSLKIDPKYAFEGDILDNKTSVLYTKGNILDHNWFSGYSIYGLSKEEIPGFKFTRKTTDDSVQYKMTVQGKNFVTRTHTYSMKKYAAPKVKVTRNGSTVTVKYTKVKADSLRIKTGSKTKKIINTKTSGKYTFTSKNKCTVEVTPFFHAYYKDIFEGEGDDEVYKMVYKDYYGDKIKKTI